MPHYMKSAAIILLALSFIALDKARAQTPLGTAFTYQGTLNDGAFPANGSYDFEFRMFDAETDGAEIGTAVSLPGIAVANGEFIVLLDFGAGAFGADARWLQIAVQAAGGGGFTTLAPRQRITPVPQAIHASTADAVVGSVPGAVANTVREFTVAPGYSVAAGQAVSFIYAAPEIRPGFESVILTAGEVLTFGQADLLLDGLTVARLSDETFVAAYTLPANSWAQCILGTVKGGALAMSRHEFIEIVAVNGIATIKSAGVTAHQSGLIIFALTYTSGVDNLERVVTLPAYVQGNQIFYGLEGTVGPPGASPMVHFTQTRAAMMSATKYAVAYTQDNGEGRVAIGEIVHDNTYTVAAENGTPVAFNTGGTLSTSITAINDSEIVVAYRDEGNLGLGIARLGTVVDRTVSFGSEVPFFLGACNDVSITALPGNRCVVSYRNSQSQIGEAVAGIVSGGALTFSNSPVTFGVFNIANTSVSAASGDTIFVFYMQNLLNMFAQSVKFEGLLPATQFPIDVKAIPFTGSVNAVGVALSDKVGVALQGHAGVDTPNGRAAAVFANMQPVIGVAKAAGNEGESVPVQLLVANTVAGGFSGLTIGADYFAQSDGSITTDSRGTRIGVAVSATEILLLP